MTLEQIIRDEITLNGPMGLGRYMALCVSHYYATRDPLGVEGDFTTAPEVSQLFGEMIGVWLADAWRQMGAPARAVLVEAGPGRGTLMHDILRATKTVQGFHTALSIHLLETSSVLIEKQRAALAGHDVQWHDSLDGLPADCPILFVANEFLDALPVEQMQFDGASWHQRALGINSKDNSLRLGLTEPESALLTSCNALKIKPREGDVFEVSPAIEKFVHELAIRMKNQGGAGLLIDYGYTKPAFGDTVQAVKKHQPVSIFKNPGECDLTAHVNFARVSEGMAQAGLKVGEPTPQGTFLKTIGIEMRLATLLDHATPSQAEDLRTGYARLIDKNQMGALFKVIGFCHDPSMQLAGF